MLQARKLALAVAVAAGGVSGSALAVGGVWDGPALTPGNGFGGRTAVWTDLVAGTGHAEWNFFTDDADPTLIVDNTPDVTAFGPGSMQTKENTGGSFLTSGGNIYSPTVATTFTVTLGGYTPAAATRTVALRTATLGEELNYGSMLLNGLAGTRYETSRQAIPGGGFGGTEVETLWLWTVTSSANYVFNFASAGSSVSMDQIAAFVGPVQAVPEPGTWALMAGGLALVGVWRARRSAV